jgi:hypothetical protein
MKYSGDSTKSDGKNNYARNENFQKLPKIAETEGTKHYAQNKTSKNLHKNAKLEGTTNTPSSKNLRYRQKVAEMDRTKIPPPKQKLAILPKNRVNAMIDTWQGCNDLSLLRPNPEVPMTDLIAKHHL